MNDILNMIKANIERNSRKATDWKEEDRASSDSFAAKKHTGVDIDDFLIGVEERNYHKKQEKKEKEMVYEEIGLDKERKNYLNSVELIDFHKLDRMKPKARVEKLIATYFDLVDVLKEVDGEMNRLEDEYNQRSIEYHQFKKESQAYRECIREIVGLLPNGASLKERLDMTGWTMKEVEEDIFEIIRHMVDRVKNAEAYVQLETERLVKENAALKRQLIKFEAALTKIEAKLLHGGGGEDTGAQRKEERKEEGKEVPEQVIEKPVEKTETAPPEEEEFDDGDGIVVLEVDRYIDNLSDGHKNILRVIGATGVSRNAELKEELENREEGNVFKRTGKFNPKEMSSVVKSLREGGFLEVEQVKLGARGGYDFIVYELTDLGKAIYKALTGKKTVISEKKKITSQHASVEHGFLIKDVGTNFREMGWTVYTERKDLRFDLPDGKRKDFDLVMEKDGKKIHVEVERGTHNDEDFFDAMDKIYQITHEFYFVAPNADALYGKTRIQFYKWINERRGGLENVKGKITVNFATFEKIKKQGKTIWETIQL